VFQKQPANLWLRCRVVREQVAQLAEERRRAFSLGHIDIDQGADLIGETYVCREEKNRDVGLGLAHLSGDLSAMHAGHGVVEDDSLDWVFGEDLEAGLAVGRGEHLIAGAFEEDFAHTQADDLIVYAQYKMAPMFHSG
jgi:hypothetical protein